MKEEDDEQHKNEAKIKQIHTYTYRKSCVVRGRNQLV